MIVAYKTLARNVFHVFSANNTQTSQINLTTSQIAPLQTFDRLFALYGFAVLPLR
jgi:hypothetical protein